MPDNITVRIAVRCNACDREDIDGAEVQGFGADAEMEQMVGNQSADAVERIVERGHFTTHRPKELRWRVICPRHPDTSIRGTVALAGSAERAPDVRVRGFEAVEALVEALRAHRTAEHSRGNA